MLGLPCQPGGVGMRSGSAARCGRGASTARFTTSASTATTSMPSTAAAPRLVLRCLVPAGVPHRVEVEPGGSVTYLVLKPRVAAPPGTQINYFVNRLKSTCSQVGLAIVSTIVSDHNGYVRVEDNVPKGSTFIVELPIAAPESRKG